MSLNFVVGRTQDNKSEIVGLTELPHLLVAGTTGSGKSVFMNSLIYDLIGANEPETLRLLLLDPKRVEFRQWRNAPHLLRDPAVSIADMKSSLLFAQHQMDLRFRVMENADVKDIDQYNDEFNRPLPYIVVVIDELANLILSDKTVENPLVAIASMGRAAGVHLVAATQRPSADVLTGLIRANVPARAAFTTVTAIESRIIIDQPGAEKLRGKGDMLFRGQGAQVLHLQGRYLSDEQIKEIAA